MDASESQDQKPEASKEDDEAQSEEMVVEQPLEQEAEPDKDTSLTEESVIEQASEASTSDEDIKEEKEED